MNKITTISILVLVFALGFFVFYNPQPVSNPIQNTEQKWETKTDEQASVTVVVTPLDLSAESNEWKFDVVMDTHSVELDKDMTKISVLVDDQGKEYKPIRWEGAEPGGHHREGVLIFGQIVPNSQSIKLKISDVGDVVRSFIWQLK
ncbi:MAG: hypothetical protein WC798_03490 [Candidatus Paceibacterota bacterium]|jgi:hypothetical protein|nr:hypothetical protein [Ignavibacteriaceae bacterium]